MIYDGATCHTNGQSTADSIAVSNQTYSKGAVYYRSEYVGYTYIEGSQRPADNATGTESNLKIQTEAWYENNITKKGFDTKVAIGKFCNDRNTANGYSWSSQPEKTFFYAAFGRVGSTKSPTLNCANSSDVHSLKAGAITADEMAFAGGVLGTGNSNYYLYNGQYYLSMSPYRWEGNDATNIPRAYVFIMWNDGHLNEGGLNSTGMGIRPVINLRSDITISSGNGRKDTPYVVQ